MINKIKKIIIVGGTHGNELTGVYLVKRFETSPHLIERSSFDSLILLANPKAILARKRYVYTDLNRCFLPQDLQNKSLNNYEQLRAKEIAQQIQQEQINFIIDLHSTTANMGLTIILNDGKNPFLLKLVAYLNLINPEVKVLQYAATEQQAPYLRHLCPLGLAIEVGSVPQGVLQADLFKKTENLIAQILDYVELFNQEKLLRVPNLLTLYRQTESVDYPRNKNQEITAMIHPSLQSQDYQPLAPGDPLFLTFEGETLTYQGDSIVYPVFINEAAYYEKAIAMSLTTQQQITLSDE